MTEVDSPKKPRRLLSSGMPGADYGVFLLATPLIGAVALLLTALAAHSLSGFVWLVVLTALVSALLAAGEIFQAPAAWESGSPLGFIGKWFAAVALVWPLGFPAYLRERRRFRFGNWFVAALIVTGVFLTVAVTAGVITVTGYGNAPPQTAEQADKDIALLTPDKRWIPDLDDISVVKTGHLDNCLGKTLDQEVSGFFEKPRWEAGATADGVDFVNIRGTVTYQGKPAEALLQFVMNKDKSGFTYRGFTIDGVPQTLFVAGLTMAQMCG